MKKLGLILIALMLLLVGCSNTGDISKKTEGNTDANQEKGYVFEVNGVSIAMNAEAAPILNSLGEAKDYFEADSCAFQGKEKTYTYNGFELHTYQLKGADYVAAIVFLDDSISTKEGIFLGSDLKDLLKAYGENYTKNLGLYTYKLAKSKISFLVENDKVTSIEYMAINE